MFNLASWKRPEFGDMTGFRSQMKDFFDRVFDAGEKEFFSESGWVPSTDISESEKNITVKAEVPGIEAKDIEVFINGRLLTIKGTKKQEKEDKNENYHRIERSYGSFNRTIELPAEVNESEVDASYKDGILKIVMKKTKESESKKIEIKTG